MGVMLGQHDLELTSSSFDVFPGGHLGAVHRGGDLFVRQFLENPQCDGDSLTAREAMNGREKFVGHLPTGEFQPGCPHKVDRLVAMVGRPCSATVAGMASCDAVCGVCAYLQYQCGRGRVSGDPIPTLPYHQERGLHRVLGILRVPRDPPHRADHAILDWLDEPSVEVVRRVH